MTELLLWSLSALWLGILTSISPCPLATNIAAISYIGKSVERPRYVLLNGALYSLGRAITYVALGVFLIAGLLSAPYASLLLQKYMNKLLGPALILSGMFLLELLSLNVPGAGLISRIYGRMDKAGSGGAALLGILFALSFCPVSAALFFGSLVPLAMKAKSMALLPSLYGIGTALPVAFFALLIAIGVRSMGRIFDRLSQFEVWARRLTGVVFIAIGFYFCFVYVFKIFE